HPATRGAAARLSLELHDLRPGRPDPAGEAMPGGAGARPEAIHAARYPQPDLAREEPPDLTGRVREPGAIVLRPDGRGRLPAVSTPPLRLERRRLRRSAHAHRPRARTFPRRARDVAEGVPL